MLNIVLSGADDAAGHSHCAGRPAPLIVQVHRLKHLWRAGGAVKVGGYLDARGLRRHRLFHQLLQALIGLAPPVSDERSLLESISNHIAARGLAPEKEPGLSAREESR